ncbi:hypothetical protein XELAEV_18030940mg [Xenopus laevis]|uniref:Helix-turn-helix domain-containing protein n=1 Tax=Xenopus laevis TaxID=8355 RepID=A0A974HF73_XENLA|nr:hypothetical protein XELAEV_18030940mg [Xenopus laevis]
MSWFEEGHVYTDVLFARHCLAWWRYIDDVFLIWRGDLDSLSAFREAINNANDDIKFTMTADLHSVNFLDVQIIRSQDRFMTRMFSKPTDRNQLLTFDSFHPPAVKKSIPISQFTRVCRITNDPTWVDHDLTTMRNKLVHRGYPPDRLDSTMDKVKIDSGRVRQKVDNRDKRLTFVGQYHSRSEKFRQILCKHWHLLKDAYPTVTEFKKPPMMSVKKGSTIGKRLVRTDMRPPQRQYTFLGPPREGMFRCKGCAQCRFVLTGDSFCSMVTNRTSQQQVPGKHKSRGEPECTEGSGYRNRD